jgi:hypothetical protein
MLEWPDVRHDDTKGGAGGTACHPGSVSGSESVSERGRNDSAIRFYDYDERPLHSAPPGRRYPTYLSYGRFRARATTVVVVVGLPHSGFPVGDRI